MHLVRGTIASLGGLDGLEWTNWAVVKVPAERRFLLRTYSDLAWRDVDLSKIDFAKAHAPRPLYDGLGNPPQFPAAGTRNTAIHLNTTSPQARHRAQFIGRRRVERGPGPVAVEAREGRDGGAHRASLLNRAWKPLKTSAHRFDAISGVST